MNTNQEDKITVEVWSDVMCPFCYIGKRKLEAALDQFPQKEKVEIIWKSFQLSPDLKTEPNKNTYDYLAEHKGISLEHAMQMSNQVTERAKLDGLVYNFDKSLVANSFKAHRFSHFAKKFGKQGEAEELLFKAYFTDGKNIDSDQTLIELALELNLDTQELSGVLTSDEYTQDVLSDIEEAQHIGVRGVPFFVFNRKYAISGAQDSQLFLETLMKSADL